MTKGNKRPGTASIPVRATDKLLKNRILTEGAEVSETSTETAPSSSRLLAEFKTQRVQHMTINYRPAKLYKGSRWFIAYYYLIPGTTEYKRFKEYFDINRITDKRERQIYADEAVAFLNQKLAMGFNPFTVIKVKSASQPRIIEQLHQIVASMEGSQTTIETYTTMKNRLVKFIDINNLHDISVAQFDVTIAEQFKDHMNTHLSKKSVNSTLAHMGMFWKRAMKLKMAVANPFEAVERVKRSFKDDEKEDVFEPLTMDEMARVISHLENEQRNFLRFISLIYYAWARPVEICRLRVEDIDLHRNIIRFRKQDTKSKKSAMVQIIPQLRKVLLEMKLEQYPKHYFLFTKNNYLPGEAMMDSEIPMNRWKKEVQDALGIRKKMYSLKHTGNIEYLLSNKGNTDLKWQQMQNRHSSPAMTERYNRQLGAYFIELADIKFKGM